MSPLVPRPHVIQSESYEPCWCAHVDDAHVVIGMFSPESKVFCVTCSVTAVREGLRFAEAWTDMAEVFEADEVALSVMREWQHDVERKLPVAERDDLSDDTLIAKREICLLADELASWRELLKRIAKR